MSIQSEIARIKANIADAFTAMSSKDGTVPSAQVSGNLAAAINSIPAGTTVQRASGTFSADSNDSFVVNTGFQPDLVIFHINEGDGNIKLHAAIAFNEDTRDEWNVQVELPTMSDGSYIAYTRPLYDGFAGNIWHVSNNFGWQSANVQFSYTAVKYT